MLCGALGVYTFYKIKLLHTIICAANNIPSLWAESFAADMYNGAKHFITCFVDANVNNSYGHTQIFLNKYYCSYVVFFYLPHYI